MKTKKTMKEISKVEREKEISKEKGKGKGMEYENYVERVD
jgi:hypothetical protein